MHIYYTITSCILLIIVSVLFFTILHLSSLQLYLFLSIHCFTYLKLYRLLRCANVCTNCIYGFLPEINVFVFVFDPNTIGSTSVLGVGDSDIVTFGEDPKINVFLQRLG